MDWLFIAFIILVGEILLIAFFWENIALLFASYSFLYDKGEKALQAENKEKAFTLFVRVANNLEFKALPKEHPIKLAVYQQLAKLSFQLGTELEITGEKDFGLKLFKEALIYKIKELQLKNEWEPLQENRPEIKELRLKLAVAYRQNNIELPEALRIFFQHGRWDEYAEVYSHFKKQLAYINLSSEEREQIESKANLAVEVIKYRQGVKKILKGDKLGKKEIDDALGEISEILSESPDFLQIFEPVFDEIKEKLGHSLVEDLQSDVQLDGEAAETSEQGEKPTNKPVEDHPQIKVDPGNSWEVIVKQLQKQSRVVSQITERPGEVIVEVQTEWYLIPLIFQEEMVDKIARTFYALSKKKEGTISFVFKDNKGREVARHTQLGIRIYN